MNSPFGLKQHRLFTLHFAKNYDEIALMCPFRQLPPAVSVHIPVIFSGLTSSSNSSPVRSPERMQASRKVSP